MDIRRFYVVSPRGERGPFSIEELSEELNAGRIMATQQVRTGMGTMLGSVREVIDTPEAMWNTAESGSGMSPVTMAQRRNRMVSFVILGLTLVPALALIALFGVGTTTVSVSVPTKSSPPTVPPSPPPLESPKANPVPLHAPAVTSSIPTTATPSTTFSTPQKFSSTPDPLAAATAAAEKGESGQSVQQASDGSLTLTATTAVITTKGARLIGKSSANPAISSWNDAEGGVEWSAKVDRPGSFLVTITYACNRSGAGSELGFKANDVTISDLTKDTGSWDDYKPHQLSQPLTIPKSGDIKFTLSPIKKKGSSFIKLSRVVLTPVR